MIEARGHSLCFTLSCRLCIEGLRDPTQQRLELMNMHHRQRNHASALSTDAELLRRAAEGDRQAFESLYLSHQQDLLTFICKRNRRSMGYHAAEDVVSEVFLRIWRYRHCLTSVRNFRAYLMGIAKNLIADAHRDQVTEVVELPQETASSVCSPDAAMEQQELARQVACALDSLAESHRLALELSQAGLSHKQIATIAGSTEKAARRRTEKARAQLRISLSRCGPSCVMGTSHQRQCPAQAKEYCCLKYMCFKVLRLRRRES